MKHKELHGEKVRKVDAMYAHEVYDYLESKEVTPIKAVIEAIVEERGYVKFGQLEPLVRSQINVPRGWSVTDIARTCENLFIIFGTPNLFAHINAEATIKNVLDSEEKRLPCGSVISPSYMPSDQEQYGRRCVYPGRRI